MIKRQHGFAMLEISLALIIAAIAALGTLKATLQAQRLEFASIQGDALKIARDAAETYAQENYAALQSGVAVTKNGQVIAPGTTSGQTYAPEVADLVRLGYLPTGFSEQGTFSNGPTPGTYRFRLKRSPAGCELTAAGPTSCNIVGNAYLDQPILAAGSTDLDGPVISTIASKIGANGGFTLLQNPATVYFLGGWTDTNPVPGNPAGVIVARFGYGSSSLAELVRIADSRDPNLQGNLTVAGDITGHGNIGTSDGVSACLRAALQTDGQIISKAANCLTRAYMNPNTGTIGVNDAAGNPAVVLDGNSGTVSGTKVTATGSVSGNVLNASTVATPGTACTTENDIANTGAAGTAGLLVCRSGLWRNVALVTSTIGSACGADGNIAINSANQETLVCQSGAYTQLSASLIKTATAGSACPQDAETAKTTAGITLICQGGAWVNLIDRIGKMAAQAAFEVTVSSATQGVIIPAPSCSGNGMPRIYLTPKAEDQISYINHFATGTGPWNIYAQDGTGNPVSAIMIAQTYCFYF